MMTNHALLLGLKSREYFCNFNQPSSEVQQAKMFKPSLVFAVETLFAGYSGVNIVHILLTM